VNRRALPLLLCLLAATTAYTADLGGDSGDIASGDLILAEGRIPDRDPFLYTSADRSTWVTSGALQKTWVTHSCSTVSSWLDRQQVSGIALFSALCGSHRRADFHARASTVSASSARR
jgi:hypothetical protein